MAGNTYLIRIGFIPDYWLFLGFMIHGYSESLGESTTNQNGTGIQQML